MVLGDAAEGFAQGGASAVGAAEKGGGAGRCGGAGGKAGLQRDAVANRGGEAGEEKRRVDGLAGGRVAGWRAEIGFGSAKQGEDRSETGAGLGVGGLWLFRFGPVGEGFRGDGAGQLHAEVSQLRAQAQVARSAFVGLVRVAWRDGVQRN